MCLPFILKRTKKEVGIQIPDILFEQKIVDWSNNTEFSFAKKVHSVLADNDTNSDNMFNNDNKLVKIMRAKQFCIYPKMIIKGLKLNFNAASPEYNYSSKLNQVIDTILERKGNGNGKLIFCHFRQEIDEIAARLRSGGIENIAIYDGRTTKSDKYDILNNKNDVLILQIQTACEGLNLQDNYNEIFFISPHWNPAIEDQAIARCHRIGQNKEVYVFRFYMSNLTDDYNSIDNCIYSKQLFKKMIHTTFEKVVPNISNKCGAEY
jgi:SNF2 family DNA or RNA helicase